MRTKQMNVVVDLERIRASAEAIRRKTGVSLIAVVKADAYGLGAERVADALTSAADEFAFFSVDEATAIERSGLIMGPPTDDPRVYIEHELRPAVSNREQAMKYAAACCAINVDTGMQRFGCDPDELDELLALTAASEVYTHAVGAASAALLRELRGNRAMKIHAASSSLLDEPECWLDAVRPGYALYRGAVRVSGRLMVVRDADGPIGYDRFECRRIGVLPCGYAHGLRAAPALINGRRQRILEVGMNTCTLSVDPSDRPGDEVVLLGDDLGEEEIAGACRCRPHEVLCRYTGLGLREYV